MGKLSRTFASLRRRSATDSSIHLRPDDPQPWSSMMRQRCQILFGVGVGSLTSQFNPDNVCHVERATVPIVLLCAFWALAIQMLCAAPQVSDSVRRSITEEHEKIRALV